jgi:hypothetical protein
MTSCPKGRRIPSPGNTQVKRMRLTSQDDLCFGAAFAAIARSNSEACIFAQFT